MSFAEMLRIVSVSQLGKYAPGGVMQFLGRGWLYSRQGMSLGAASRAMLIENIWQWSAAVFLGIGLLCTARLDPAVLQLGQISLPAFSVTALISIGVAFLAWWWCSSVAEARLVSPECSSRIPRMQLGLSYMIAWVLLGISFLALWPVDFTGRDLILATGAFASSSAAGFVVPIAPAGLGVREAALVLTTAGRLDAEEAAIAAGLNRLVWIGIELLLAGCMIATTSMRRARARDTET